jgi:hypothetical protein
MHFFVFAPAVIASKRVRLDNSFPRYSVMLSNGLPSGAPPLARLLVLFSVATQARGASTGAACSGLGISDWRHACRQQTIEDILASHPNVTNGRLFQCCNAHCPVPQAADLKSECMHGHAFHSKTDNFRAKQTYRQSMQWNIFFICLSECMRTPRAPPSQDVAVPGLLCATLSPFLVFCPPHSDAAPLAARALSLSFALVLALPPAALLFGALVRMSVPAWIPYTVFVMVACFVVGILAHMQEVKAECPWHALEYDGYVDGVADDRISRDEWDAFLCSGCTSGSYCLSTSHPLFGSGDGWPRTCGDGGNETGDARVGSCSYTFASLNRPWRHTDMRTEFVLDEHGTGYLSPDELWRPECNLFRDIIGLADVSSAAPRHPRARDTVHSI